MTPQTDQPQEKPVEKIKIQRSVFDLASFDDVKLVKVIDAPTPVTSVEEALAAVGNNKDALLAVINDGLRESARETAAANIEGFVTLNENGEPGEPYTGKFADESKSKLINAAVLNLAKMFSGGAWDSAAKEQKRAWKDQAVDMLRSNPAMLASIQG